MYCTTSYRAPDIRWETWKAVDRPCELEKDQLDASETMIIQVLALCRILKSKTGVI